MKLHTYLKSGLIVALTTGFMTSCSDNADSISDNDAATITVKVVASDLMSTRAGNYTDFQSKISTGSQIDKLVYAVYNDKGELLEYFQTDENSGKGLGKGQNVMDFYGETTLVLKVSKEVQYQILCWAQSSDCDAYDTKDLTNVKVTYTKNNNGTNNNNNYLNNDETRDAFCGKSIVFSGSATSVPDIELKRPFAQINVGTTGADFRMSAKIPGGTYYTYSTITVKGAAQTFNILTNSVPETDQPIDVTYTWNKIPAYWDMTTLPTVNDLVKTDGEEFLLVDLDNDGKNLEYKTLYPTMTVDNKYLTEEFKYMSMCYVLTDGTPFSEVTLGFSGAADGKATDSANTSFTLLNVPAKQNFRTNILGGLKYFNAQDYTDPKDPNDPNDPEDPEKPDPKPGDDIPEDKIIDDPTTLFSAVSVNVIILENYDGDQTPPIIIDAEKKPETPSAPEPDPES